MYLSLHPLLIGCETCNQCEMMNKSKSCMINFCIILLGAYIVILFTIQVRIFPRVKWSFRSSKIVVTQPRMTSIYEHVLQPPSNTCFGDVCCQIHTFFSPNYISLKYRCPIYCYVGFSHIYLINFYLCRERCCWKHVSNLQLPKPGSTTIIKRQSTSLSLLISDF